jgi:hypothetical protein
VDTAPVIIVVGIALLVLVAIIVAPFRRVRSEPRLPSDVEARVLLGERPDEIDAELEAEHRPPAPRHRSGPQRVPPAAS